jgi:hypothetical protein
MTLILALKFSSLTHPGGKETHLGFYLLFIVHHFVAGWPPLKRKKGQYTT